MVQVESGSKYRMRLSGIVLVKLFENRGTVDNVDFPTIATAHDQVDSPNSFWRIAALISNKATGDWP